MQPINYKYWSKLIYKFKIFSIYTIAIFCISAGVTHFKNYDFFEAIVPPVLVFKSEIVYVSGVIEIVLGLLLCSKKTRHQAAWGIVFLLIIIFPANLYLCFYDVPKEALGISNNQAFIRLTFQIPLFIIAYWHSLDKTSKRFSILCTFFIYSYNNIFFKYLTYSSFSYEDKSKRI